jgi:hypothetical protein
MVFTRIFMVPLTHKDGSVTQEEFTIWATNGMEWLKERAGDERLGNEREWYAHKKFLVLDG